MFLVWKVSTVNEDKLKISCFITICYRKEGYIRIRCTTQSSHAKIGFRIKLITVFVLK